MSSGSLDLLCVSFAFDLAGGLVTIHPLHSFCANPLVLRSPSGRDCADMLASGFKNFKFEGLKTSQTHSVFLIAA